MAARTLLLLFSILLIIIWITNISTAQHSEDVVLTSTLADDHTAPPKEEIVFTCITRDSDILQWSSSEYISSDGYNIQVYNSTQGTDVRRGSAHAILVRAAIENGVLVLVSELRIRASTLHPTATIQCDNNVGHGSNQTIIFNSINRPIPRLNSSLSEGMFACPGERIQFECATTDSLTLVWMSESYFGSDAALRFSYNSSLNVPQNVSAVYYAMLTSKSMDTGRINLTAILSITVLESIRDYSHSIVCLNEDMGTHTNVSFHLAEMCEESTTINLSTKSNDIVESGSNDNSPVVVPVVVVAAIIMITIFIIIIILWTHTHKGRSSKNCNSVCLGDQVQASHYKDKENIQYLRRDKAG